MRDGDPARRRLAMAAHGALDARRIGGGRRVDGRRHLGAAPGARGLSPVVRAPGPIVPAAARRRASPSPGARRASVAGCRRGRTACGTRSSRGAWRLPVWIALGAGATWLAPGSGVPVARAAPRARDCSSPSSRSRAPSPCGPPLSSSCWSSLRLWLRPTEGAAPFHGRHLRAAADRDAGVRLRGAPDRRRRDARATARRDDHQDPAVASGRRS